VASLALPWFAPSEILSLEVATFKGGRSITEGDADDYRSWLLNIKKLAKGGIGRDIGRAKTFSRQPLEGGWSP
jgi:hypothetical protein